MCECTVFMLHIRIEVSKFREKTAATNSANNLALQQIAYILRS